VCALSAEGALPSAGFVSHPAQPQPGLVVGRRYRLESLLGEGGMAVVWRALHTETERPVALKLVRPNLAANEQARELFVREAKIAARVGRSEHIVDVLDAGVDEALAVPFLAMELLEGEPLDARLKREGALDRATAARLLEQLGEALDQAHAAGVVHRDLKPQNLFLARTRKGPPVLKVLDFGIAKVAEAAHQTSTQIGTPAYAAPEQLGPSWRAIGEGRGRRIATAVSPETDVWAIGLVAFEMLTAVHTGELWGATTLAELPLKVVLEPTPIASARAGGQAHLLPPGFDAWLGRCLEVDATRRFPTAGEAVAALVALLAPPGSAPSHPPGLGAAAAPVGWAAAPAAPPAVSAPHAPVGPRGPVVPHGGWSAASHPGWHPAAAAGSGPRPIPARPPDPLLASWAAARGLEIVHADLPALKTLEPWAFLPVVVTSGREVRGPFGGGTVSLVEVRCSGIGRATGDDRSVLTIVQSPRVRARAAVQSRAAAGFADNVARGMKLLDALVAEPSHHVGVHSIGDALLESHFELRCPSAMEGHAALPPPLRAYLVHQHFRGTVELRIGRFAMMHYDVTSLEPQALDYVLSAAAAILQALGP
jgi:serine/threonine-protein kinase